MRSWSLYWDSSFSDSLTLHLEAELKTPDPLSAPLTASSWTDQLSLVAEGLMSYPWEEASLHYHDTAWRKELRAIVACKILV